MATNQGNTNAGNIHVEVDVPAAGGTATGRATPTASQGNSGAQAAAGQGVSDNRGKVLHPETDGRLKGNEEHRPNDKDRSAQAAGGQKGGMNSHGNTNGRPSNQ